MTNVTDDGWTERKRSCRYRSKNKYLYLSAGRGGQIIYLTCPSSLGCATFWPSVGTPIIYLVSTYLPHICPSVSKSLRVSSVACKPSGENERAGGVILRGRWVRTSKLMPTTGDVLQACGSYDVEGKRRGNFSPERLRDCCEAAELWKTPLNLVHVLAVSVFFVCVQFHGYCPEKAATLFAIVVSLAQLIVKREDRSIERQLVQHHLPSNKLPVPENRVTICSTTSRLPPATTEALAISNSPASGENLFEGAITRLAGATELGTESLVYVRREDVVTVIDTLVQHAHTPGLEQAAVSSPALARLTMVRSSRKTERTRRRIGCSPEFRIPRNNPAPPRTRGSSSHAGHGGSNPSSSNRPRSVGSLGGPVTTLRRTSLQKDDIPHDHERSSNSSGRRVSGTVSCAISSSNAEYSRAAHRVRSHRHSEMSRCRQLQRSTPVAAFRVAQTPVALIDNAPSSTQEGDVATISPSFATEGKITCVPITTHATGDGAAFADFWSSGWG